MLGTATVTTVQVPAPRRADQRGPRDDGHHRHDVSATGAGSAERSALQPGDGVHRRGALADLVENIHAAYRHPGFQQAAYAVLLSGPSGSADIGGKTVHPAQGVTTLTVILAPRPGMTTTGAGR
jgi:hypothetical protein